VWNVGRVGHHRSYKFCDGFSDADTWVVPSIVTDKQNLRKSCHGTNSSSVFSVFLMCPYNLNSPWFLKVRSPQESHIHLSKKIMAMILPADRRTLEFLWPWRISVVLPPVGVPGSCVRCGCEVPVIILLLVAYLYIYSLLRGVTFQVLSLSSYTLSTVILSLLETFLELLLWNKF
jgi:hypothetical protein